MRVESWLLRAARRRPAHPALGTTTYAELLAAVDHAAAALRDEGVRAGDAVGLTLAPGRAFVVALHAALRAGARAVPVDPRTPAPERERRLAAAGVGVTVDAALPEHGGVAPARGGPLRDAHDVDDTAIVVHTSGTSGPAKPIPLSFGNWLWSALGSAAALGHPPHERWLAALPLNHVGGLSILLRSAIAGTTAVVHEGWDTERVLGALRAPDGPTVVSLVPTTLRRLLDAGLRHPPVLRWALLGGAPVPAGLLEEAAAAGVPVAPTYGMSETCSQIATHGVPLFCTRVRVAALPPAEEASRVGALAGAGEDGEVLVAGPTVAAVAAGADGWLRTGDLGRWDEHGRLRITGRRAETIVSGGENVLPGEVEAVLEAHPDVLEAGVHGAPDPEWGEVVRAVVVLRPGAAVDGPALAAWARGRLLPFQVPKAVAVRAALPRTPSGKLLRRDLAG